MLNLLLAFITGLTTGGLSCLAVQGGLLASSLARQIENDVQTLPAKGKRKPAAADEPRPLAAPILAFLAAKLAAYTLLGMLLGLAGQTFQLSPMTRAFLQIAIGVFMLGTALRMFNVHPIFRFFAFEPPARLRRWLRRKAADGAEPTLAAPLFLGALTVLIPCGVTQAMMAAALATGSPLGGATLMFAFTLGASPVFFAVAYFATRLGKRLEKNFTRVVAALILVLALVTIDSGVTLAGSPVSITRVIGEVTAKPRPQIAAPAPATPALQPQQVGPTAPAHAGGPSADDGVITIQVEDFGYNPDVVHAKAGVPTRLRLNSQDVNSCSLAFVIPSLNVQQILQPTGEAYIDIPAQAAGTVMPFSCSMGMFTGDIIFDL